MKALKKVLNEEEEFKKASRWFVGSVALKFGEHQYTLKIDRGAVLEVQEGTDIFGSTFAISGPMNDWKALITGQEPGLAKLTTVTPEFKCGNLTFEGNIVEAIRSFKISWIMTQDMKKIETEF
jgi:putative sterol carrier protein